MSKFLRLAALISGAVMVLGTASAADAGTHDPGVNARQRRQQHRIAEGVRSGELTKPEAKGLEQQERGIRQEERQFKSDGQLTAGERAKLQSDLNKTSKDIYQEKHDAQVRPGNTHDPVVNARQHAQQGRIAEGVRSGELTKGEAKGLEQQERGIRQEERQFKSDGQLTAAERAKLQTDLNKTSRDIYQEKHDAEKRGTALPAPPAPPTSK